MALTSDTESSPRELRQRKRHEKRMLRAQRASELFVGSINSTSKQLLWIMVVNSVLWIWCSYLLALLGKDQIAESLSSNVCSVILGQIITYFLTKTVENVFKNNNFGGIPRWQYDAEHNNTGEFTYTPPEIVQPTIREETNYGSEAGETGTDCSSGTGECEETGGVDPGSLD